jgi:hypothetical protein
VLIAPAAFLVVVIEGFATRSANRSYMRLEDGVLYCRRGAGWHEPLDLVPQRTEVAKATSAPSAEKAGYLCWTIDLDARTRRWLVAYLDRP